VITLKKTTITIMGAAALFISSGVATAQDTFYTPGNNQVKLGMEAMQAQNYEQASKRFNNALRLTVGPKTKALVLNNLCAADYQRDALKQALRACNQAVRMNKQDWRALANRGNVYVAMGEFSKAKNSFERADRINPNIAGVKRFLAEYNRTPNTQYVLNN